MAIIPFDCAWHDDYIEVYQTDGKTKSDHGIYNSISGKLCNKCGNPNLWITKGKSYCYESFLDKKLRNIDGTFQLGYYYKKKLRQFKKDEDVLTGHILKLKFYQNGIYAKPLGKAMYLSIKNRHQLLLEADSIVPVPNHPDDPNFEVKAVALANELGNQFRNDGKEIEVIDAIHKVTNISTRGFSRDEKEALVEQGLFEFNIKVSISNRKIILVDDVLTNGIIKGKCTNILRENGAEKIWGYVAGRNFSEPIFDDN